MISSSFSDREHEMIRDEMRKKEEKRKKFLCLYNIYLLLKRLGSGFSFLHTHRQGLWDGLVQEKWSIIHGWIICPSRPAGMIIRIGVF